MAHMHSKTWLVADMIQNGASSDALSLPPFPDRNFSILAPGGGLPVALCSIGSWTRSITLTGWLVVSEH